MVSIVKLVFLIIQTVIMSWTSRNENVHNNDNTFLLHVK